MTGLTTLDDLKRNLTLLTSVEPSDAPFVSTYLNVNNGAGGWRETLDERVRTLRGLLRDNDLADLEEAVGRIEDWLATELLPEAKGVAIFVRGAYGGSFMLAMQFATPLPNWIAVYPTPNIYHLVALKDDFHRYVVLLARPDRASILEVNLGAVTTRAWINRSESDIRVGTESARSAYQINQAHRGKRFIAEKVSQLARLMRGSGQTHLILAGDPAITVRIRQALPRDLANKLVDVIPASDRDAESDVVTATLSRFIDHEEQESQTVAERLIEGLRSHDLAVAGSAATFDALKTGEVDTVVMVSDYQPDIGWHCTSCDAQGTRFPDTGECPRCGTPEVRPLDVKEALLRLAGQLERRVEVVESFDPLMALGGVGCLLRYRSESQPEPWDGRVAARG